LDLTEDHAVVVVEGAAVDAHGAELVVEVDRGDPAPDRTQLGETAVEDGVAPVGPLPAHVEGPAVGALAGGVMDVGLGERVVVALHEDLGTYPITTVEKQRLNMIGNLV
jgi:hypothetical protein